MPTKVDEPVRSYPRAPSTTFWVQMPVLERKALANIRRNTGWLSVARADPGV